MKTLKSKVVYEDIHIEDYDKRRHHMKPMELEDLDLSSSFSFVLSHRNHRTVKWGPREPVRLTEVMPNQKPMSSSEDYESESCPESDKSALLVAQVKLTCEFEI